MPLTPARVPPGCWCHPQSSAILPSKRPPGPPCVPSPGAPGILRDPCTTRPHSPFQHSLAKVLPSSRTTDGAPARGKAQGRPRPTSPGLQRRQTGSRRLLGTKRCTAGGQAGRTRSTAREPLPGPNAAPDPPHARQPALWPRRGRGRIHGDPAAFPWGDPAQSHPAPDARTLPRRLRSTALPKPPFIPV